MIRIYKTYSWQAPIQMVARLLLLLLLLFLCSTKNTIIMAWNCLVSWHTNQLCAPVSAAMLHNVYGYLVLLLTINRSTLGNLLKSFHRGLLKNPGRVCLLNTTSCFIPPATALLRVWSLALCVSLILLSGVPVLKGSLRYAFLCPLPTS